MDHPAMDPPCPRPVRDPPLWCGCVVVVLWCVGAVCVFKIFVGASKIWALPRLSSAGPLPRLHHPRRTPPPQDSPTCFWVVVCAVFVLLLFLLLVFLLLLLVLVAA